MSKCHLCAKDNGWISVTVNKRCVHLQVTVSTAKLDKCPMWGEGLRKDNKRIIPHFQNVFDLGFLSRQGLNF